MFDIAPSEFLLTAIIAIVVIGPKDMPMALRTAGRWIGKMRRMSNHLRSGFEAMIHEAEMEEMNRKWREQNEAIMRANPVPPEEPTLPLLDMMAEDEKTEPASVSAEARTPRVAEPAAAQPLP